MKRTEMTQTKLQALFKKEEQLLFPKLLQEVRKLHGLTRRTVCKDLAMSEMRMFWLENGYFKRGIPDTELFALAEYYGINPMYIFNNYALFMKKAQDDPSLNYQPKRKQRKQ